MAFVDAPCALWLLPSIQAKDDMHDLMPIGTLGICVKKTQIGHKMALIVGG